MRFPERMRYDLDTIVPIVDEALYCHVGLTTEQGPFVVPTVHARREHTLYLHGSVLSGWMRAAESARLCVTMTILDDLVLARSAYNHSLNYRSVIAVGRARTIADPDEKLAALRAIVEHICPGRWGDVRLPTNAELRATLVLALNLDEAAAKIRSGPPDDAGSDVATSYWAGCVPIRLERKSPVADPTLQGSIPTPRYLGALVGRL
jgi:uncharacterized protein